MLCKSNNVLNLVFCVMHNGWFSNSNLNQILKKMQFHKHGVNRVMLEIICHLFIDSSNEKVPDLNNNGTGLE